MSRIGPSFLFLLLLLFVSAIVLSVWLEKLHKKIKRMEKALKRLEGEPEPLEEPAEWL